MLGTVRVGAGGDVLTGGVEGGGPPGPLCSPGGAAHVCVQPPAPALRCLCAHLLCTFP